MRKIDPLSESLIHILALDKRKSYLPVWGELYCILRDVKRQGKKLNENIVLYNIDPIGTLFYDYLIELFVVTLEEFQIKMSDQELIDILLDGRFKPRD